MAAKLFCTHHSPVGAWASLTFGHPADGLSIDLEDPKMKNSGSLLVGKVDQGVFSSICFSEDANLKQQLGAASETDMGRTLTASVDAYSHGDIAFKVYTPFPALPDPEKEAITASHCMPGILLELTVDNSACDHEVTAFIGLALNDAKRAYASKEDGLYVLRHKDEWEFALQATEDTYLVRGLDALKQLQAGSAIVQQNGMAFFCCKVPAGEVKTLTLSWSVYRKSGSNGTLTTDYYYSHLFENLRQVSLTMQSSVEQIRELANELDSAYMTEDADPLKQSFFFQALRGYYASSQLLIDGDKKVHWNISEGGYVWRNTMDLCADHIVWELRQNPWVVRSLMDDFLKYYTYYDRVTFEGREGTYPGGISFTHDMGCFYTYSEKGHSAYERENDTKEGFYFYMTTEELLNGIYCICAYVLHTGDTEWLKKYPNLLPDLMTSLENRDAFEDGERNGILKAASLRGGACHLESTTYDALDHSLLDASGNVYVFIKTWCALILLEKCGDLMADASLLARAQIMKRRCEASAHLFESKKNPWLKANAYKDLPGAVCAAAEPLAVPYMLGILSEDAEPALYELMKKHLTACLQTGVCIDSISGGLKLSSTSTNTWPSKSVLTVYVAEEVLQFPMPRSVTEKIIGWAQVSAAHTTISDQIHSESRSVIGAPYYPRIVTAILWVQ